MQGVPPVKRFTVLGGGGFIGSNLSCHLEALGYSVHCPGRDEIESLPEDLGHVIYAIGLTGDFRARPLDTIDAHVNVLKALLFNKTYDSFLYLSSTRIYSGVCASEQASEDLEIPIRPGLDAIYDISKLLGESLCLMQKNPMVRVARLSNVYGRGQSCHTFLQMLIEESVKGHVEIHESCRSGKDYVAIEDVVSALEKIATQGQHRIYNVASGNLVTHEELAGQLSSLSGANVVFSANGVERRFPLVSTERLVQEFGWSPKNVLEDLVTLL